MALTFLDDICYLGKAPGSFAMPIGRWRCSTSRYTFSVARHSGVAAFSRSPSRMTAPMMPSTSVFSPRFKPPPVSFSSFQVRAISSTACHSLLQGPARVEIVGIVLGEFFQPGAGRFADFDDLGDKIGEQAAIRLALPDRRHLGVGDPAEHAHAGKRELAPHHPIHVVGDLQSVSTGSSRACSTSSCGVRRPWIWPM